MLELLILLLLSALDLFIYGFGECEGIAPSRDSEDDSESSNHITNVTENSYTGDMNALKSFAWFTEGSTSPQMNHNLYIFVVCLKCAVCVVALYIKVLKSIKFI